MDTTANSLFIHAYRCPICNITVEGENAQNSTVGCDGPCQQWYHKLCANLSHEEFRNIRTNDEAWLCPSCTIATSALVLANRVTGTESAPQPSVEMTGEHSTDSYPVFQRANTGLTGQSKWGILEGYAEINECLQKAYDEVVKWKKKLFSCSVWVLWEGRCDGTH